ncbi:splicing factor 45 [Onthophagus taurus]|uniref:splicing factor 45 n=1 Tax=Onthophagus taurus TaxID=166361 RepID=UPI0039BE7CE5
MSLYDDFDVKARPTESVQGWSSSIKLLQSQLQLKKAAVTQPKRDQQRKASLPPVIDLKHKKHDEDVKHSNNNSTRSKEQQLPIISGSNYKQEYDWNVIDEYDPLWPNEYEKIVKELRDNRDRDLEKEEKRRDRRRKSRFSEAEDDTPPQASLPQIGSGFAGRWADDEEEIEPPPKIARMGQGAAIAPPPSLQEALSPPRSSSLTSKSSTPTSGTNTTNNINNNSSSYSGSSVAAKIMAKYGFKEGQGLGKQEQGMSMALQVEKTSKRGGRIIHEKEIQPAPMIEDSYSPDDKSEPTITEMMKAPSKVVLLRNMVGPGEVDDDLEPEVKDECNQKYGDVGSVIIHEINTSNPEEGVRIFVEFKRIESAIKAVVDLNGRFFGGRQVKASFYDTEKFDNLQLE